jgi:hypothetical protein
MTDCPSKLQSKIKGLQELTRMTSRDQIKGCIRKLGQNPHENRFEKPYDSNYWQ